MNLNCIVIDVEGGSLNPETGALLDIAAVELRDGEIRRSFRQRVLPEPGLLIEPDAVACNGYAPEKWAEWGAIPEVEALGAFLAFLGGFGRDLLTWAGHNTAFDRRYIEAAFIRQGYAPRAVLPTRFHHRDVDLMHLAVIPVAQGIAPSRSLDSLRQTLLESTAAVLPGADHDALGDATDTARLLGLFSRRLQWMPDLTGLNESIERLTAWKDRSSFQNGDEAHDLANIILSIRCNVILLEP